MIALWYKSKHKPTSPTAAELESRNDHHFGLLSEGRDRCVKILDPQPTVFVDRAIDLGLGTRNSLSAAMDRAMVRCLLVIVNWPTGLRPWNARTASIATLERFSINLDHIRMS